MADPIEHGAAARRRRKTLALVLLAVTIVLLIVAIIWWRSLPNEDVAVYDDPAAPVALTGAELMTIYESDRGLAEFGQGPVLVTAPLATTPISSTTVLLSTADPLLDISADLVPADAVRLADIERGSKVTLLCEGISAGLRAPRLENCTVAME